MYYEYEYEVMGTGYYPGSALPATNILVMGVLHTYAFTDKSTGPIAQHSMLDLTTACSGY